MSEQPNEAPDSSAMVNLHALAPHPEEAEFVRALHACDVGETSAATDNDGRIIRLFILYSRVTARELDGISALSELSWLRILRCPHLRLDNWIASLEKSSRLRYLSLSVGRAEKCSLLQLFGNFNQLEELEILSGGHAADEVAALRDKLPRCKVRAWTK